MKQKAEYHLCGAKTVNEFASAYRLGRTKIYSLAREGKIKLTKIGKSTRILADDEANFVASLSAKPKVP